MLKHAFKEWAVICRALVLHKGGIAEDGGRFQVVQAGGRQSLPYGVVKPVS